MYTFSNYYHTNIFLIALDALISLFARTFHIIRRQPTARQVPDEAIPIFTY